LRRGAEGVTPPGPDDDVVLSPAESLAVAQDLLDTGWPFRAHEILEATWKQTSGDERGVWKGLAQLAVGVTHAERGNPAGARRLIERGRDAIIDGSDAAPDGIDVDGLRAWADESLHALLDANSPLVLPTPRLGRMCS
jgi:predicted metal-dependent hydrolase